jgi:hypothetical protein
MTTAKNKGGHPFTPRNAEEVRHRIAAETVKTNPREQRLRNLYRLLKAFVQAEQQRRDEARARALEEANALKAAEVQLRRAEYQRRYNKSEGGLGLVNLRRENDALRRRVAELEAGKEVA